MLRLFGEHDMEREISQCRPEEILVDQGAMHHAFCCTIKVIEYFDTTTGIQTATIDRQDYVDGNRPSVRFIRMFRVGLDG